MARPLAALVVLSLTLLASPASAQTVDIHEGTWGNEPIDYSTRASMIKAAALTRGQLARRVNFGGIANPKTTLADALSLFERSSGIPIDINAQAFQDEGVDDVLSRPVGRPIPKMQGVPATTVLSTLLGRIPSRSGITFFPRASTVEISTARYYRYELRLTGAIVRPAPPCMPRP
jgi:hypothetical protein